MTWRSTASRSARRRCGSASSPRPELWPTPWASSFRARWRTCSAGNATLSAAWLAPSSSQLCLFSVADFRCLRRPGGGTGWVGLVKVSSRWFSYSTYGTVMAVLSLSYLFGDAACRWVMGQLMAFGLGWRGVFLAGAGSLALLLLANLVFLRETPEERGLPTPEANPLNVYAEDERQTGEETVGLRAILRPLLSSFPFWMVCLLSRSE